MYGEIVFYTHGSTIEYGGEIFAAGELTADILNFAPEDYRPIQRLLNRMKELARQYEDTLERGVWWELNNRFIELRSQLMRYRVFQILLKEDDQFLNETQQYTESYSLFTDEEMDEQYELISQKYGQPVDVVKQVLPKAQLKPDLLRMKASQLIIDAAEIIMEESGK